MSIKPSPSRALSKKPGSEKKSAEQLLMKLCKRSNLFQTSLSIFVTRKDCCKTKTMLILKRELFFHPCLLGVRPSYSFKMSGALSSHGQVFSRLLRGLMDQELEVTSVFYGPCCTS